MGGTAHQLASIRLRVECKGWRTEFLNHTRFAAKESGVPSTGTKLQHRISRQAVRRTAATMLVAMHCALAGCSLFPDVRHKPQYINPFPQIQTVAVLPFFNQSEEPTLSGERVALAYINELQSIRGFEVLPLGAVKTRLNEYQGPLTSGEHFQDFARFLGVDVVLVGAVTDYSAYYPPRMALKVSWYAANPAFHPVQPGYGLPWGTKEEKDIPRWIQYESQRALAAKQLETQTPLAPSQLGILPEDRAEPLPLNQSNLQSDVMQPTQAAYGTSNSSDGRSAKTRARSVVVTASATSSYDHPLEGLNAPEVWSDGAMEMGAMHEPLPEDWPDPRGFIPDSPTANRPKYRPQHEPIISHMRTFNGHDEDVTEQLADYFYYRDDARFGGWQAYLQRSEDFIRFCCYLHLSETLASRGGQDKSRLILRWPIDRYTR